MEEIIALILGNPVIREFFVHLTVEIVAEIFHRRSSDPEFKAASDSAFQQWTAAKSEEERLNAQRALQSLLARPA